MQKEKGKEEEGEMQKEKEKVKVPTEAFTTPWTPDSIKAFRARMHLRQSDLAYLLHTKQQRINEWEQGKHKMKRAYTHMMNELEQRLIGIRRRTGTNKEKYCELILKELGVEIKWN